jgi:Polyketide cyclase / dehydrase and lipid transport
MATIRKSIAVNARAAAVWDAVRDVEALHERIAPGLVTSTEMVAGETPPLRRVTFADGLVLHERIVAVDQGLRRLVWTIEGDQVDHHNGALEVTDAGDQGTHVAWTADVLPDALAEPFADIMDKGLSLMKATLEAAQQGGR